MVDMKALTKPQCYKVHVIKCPSPSSQENILVVSPLSLVQLFNIMLLNRNGLNTFVGGLQISAFNQNAPVTHICIYIVPCQFIAKHIVYSY